MLFVKNFPAGAAPLHEVHSRLRKGEFHTFWYVAPTKRLIRKLQREFLELSPGEISPAFNLFTLETLAQTLYGNLTAPKRHIAGPLQALVMAKAVKACAGELSYFRFRHDDQLAQGTFEKILDVINALKNAGVYPSTLFGELETAEINESAKLKDILAIYTKYEALLADTFVDTPGILRDVNNFFLGRDGSETFLLHYPAVNFLFINGFDEFSDPELTLIYHLSRIPRLQTAVMFDYRLGNDEIFGHLKQNYEKLGAMGFEMVREANGSLPINRRSRIQNQLSDSLFQRGSIDSKIDVGEFVTLIEAQDRVAETDAIVRKIKSWVEENPSLELNSICIAMYRPELYTQLFRETFHRYGIPANITDRYYLDRSPLVSAILSLLAVAENDFRHHDVMRALSSPYLRFPRGPKGTVDGGNLLAVAALLKITGGLSMWHRRMTARMSLITRDLQRAEDDLETESLLREQHMLEKAGGDLLVLEKLLRPFKDAMTPLEWKKAFLKLLDCLNIDQGILEGLSASPHGLTDSFVERDARAYQKLRTFIDEFFEMLLYETSRSEKTSFYREHFIRALSQVRYNVRQRYGYGVVVTSLEETRGLPFSRMIVAGLVDGEFPPVYQPEIFFSSERRQQQERYHLHEHRYRFYQVVTNFTESLVLTYPGFDGETELVRSSFVEALLHIGDVGIDSPAPRTGREACYSVDEVYEFLGRSIRYDALMEGAPVPPGADIEVVGAIRRAIGIESNRLLRRPPAAYHGRMDEKLSPDFLSALESMHEKIYSVTQLEMYGKCPFQFFSDRILRLKAFAEPDEAMTPLERGGLMHDILFEFFTARRSARRPPLAGCSEKEFQEALSDLRDIARAKLDEFDLDYTWWDLDRELILGTERRKGLLHEILEHERVQELDVVPAYFEAGFGSNVGSRQQRDPIVSTDQTLQAGRVKLRGKIDRIDAGNEGMFRIIDYKTGSATFGRKEIEEGISLQLPIYLHAVEHLLLRRESYEGPLHGGAGIYYQLRSPIKEVVGIGDWNFKGRMYSSRSRSNLVSSEELQEIIAGAIRHVNEYVDRIAAGDFRIEPKDREKCCTPCRYKTVCRIQTLQPTREEP